MKIAIIGAGLAGLSCAFRLEQQGFSGQLDIFEKKPGVGEANLFLEFISELFHRPIQDFFAFLAEEYQLYLKPLLTINQSQTFGTHSSTMHNGFIGHIVVRGRHEEALERQLARKIKSNIFCGQEIKIDEIRQKYDLVVVATGRLQDVPPEVGVRLDRYVNFYHGLIQGSFDKHMIKVWFNQSYAKKGYSFLLPLDSSTAMISVTSPDRNFDLEKGWNLFVREVFGEDTMFDEIHIVKNFAIGQPLQYNYKNLIFVGNVAGGITPALGFGLHNAILTGLYAADAILQKKDFALMMRYYDKEYRWSLALRNALEQMNDAQYNLLVDGMNSSIGKAILKPGGVNFHRLGGRILSSLTKETKKSFITNDLDEYVGRSIYKSEAE